LPLLDTKLVHIELQKEQNDVFSNILGPIKAFYDELEKNQLPRLTTPTMWRTKYKGSNLQLSPFMQDFISNK